MILRRLDGVSERGIHEVEVIGILDESALTRPAVLVDLEVLIAMEDFRDGFKVPEFGLNSGKERPSSRSRFARARIYAKSLDDVAKIAAWLDEKEIESKTRIQEIESVKAISRVLGLIFSVIAWTAVVGCIASLIGAFLANIERKRKDLAVLRLLGFRRSAAGGYIIVQATFLTGIAFLCGVGGYLIGARIFNQALGKNLEQSGIVCHLSGQHLLIAFITAFTIGIIVAALGSYRAINIQPSESLRAL
jgi:putative ABC transport system permease protein